MTEKIKTSAILGCFLGAALLVGACGDEAFSTAADFQATVTIRADESVYDFSGIGTYDMPDEVFDLAPVGTTPLYVEHAFDDEILEEVAQQMASRGFVRIDDEADTDGAAPTEPDVYLTVAMVAQIDWTYSGTYAFGDEAGMYVYYPEPSVPLSYSSDSIILTMVDRRITHDGETVVYEPVWTAGIHAALAYTTADTVLDGISQAFEQSPYLQAATGGAR